MTKKGHAVFRLFLALLGLAALKCYEPVITGHLWYRNFGDPLLMALRKSILPFLVIVYFSARFGKRWGFITAPAVVITSGIWYAYVERDLKGDRDFGENIMFAVCASVLFALPLGWLISHNRARIDDWLSFHGSRRKHENHGA
jgi:hypothetical protein